MTLKADVPLCTGCGTPEGTLFPPPAQACCPEPQYLSHRQLVLLYETAKREIMEWKQHAEAAMAQAETERDEATLAEAERDAAVERAEVAEAVAQMAAHDRDEALVNLDAACKAARANAAELMQGTIDGITRERDAARAEATRLRDAILRVLDDDESKPGGWGPDVTMQAVLREALSESRAGGA